MKRLGMLVDQMAFIRTALQNPHFDPVQFAVLGETAGAHGIVCTYTGTADGISERDVKLLKEMCKSFLNVRIPLNDAAFHLALSVAPDMVTFIDMKPSDPQTVRPIDTTIHLEEIQRMMSDLQANNISVAALIEPEITVLKSINRLALDYVEIDATGYTTAESVNDELVFLDKIKSTAMGAGKLGMGVNCSGKIRFEHIPFLAQVPNLEDIVMGEQLLQRAVWLGVDRVINEALQLLKYGDAE